MAWRQLDVPTRVGVVATVIAVSGASIPPLGVASAVVAIGFSATAVLRGRRRNQSNRVALICLVVSIGLIVLIIIGNAIYAATD
jgi:hypothetical protein